MKLSLLLFTLLFCLHSMSQTKPKKNSEKIPTQQEMNDMMKEMQKAMDDMSDEDKKMMDSMGVKMPDMNNMQSMAKFAMANAGKTGEELLVPKRDATRIAALPKSITNDKLQAYFSQLQKKLAMVFDANTVSTGNKICDYIKSNTKSSRAAGNMAMGLWMNGKPRLATYVLGKICEENATDIDNQLNYSSMLIMMGGQHLAIPILNNLNTGFPKNTTILNNLGQAWFGLGEISRAEKYFDSTIRIYAYHPQANATKAVIEESKGNKTEAIKAATNAIHDLYSNDKEQQLDKLGYKLKQNDVTWGRPNATDQLGLSRFLWPAFPKNVKESETLENEWKSFTEELNKAKSELSSEKQTLEAVYRDAYQKRLQHDLTIHTTASRRLALMEGLVPKAAVKLRPYIDMLMDIEAREPLVDVINKLERRIDSLKDEASKQIQKLEGGAGGEGSGIDPAYCAAVDAINSNLLRDANTLVEETCARLRERVKRRITEMVNYQMYIEFPEKFNLSVCLAKLEWLGYIGVVNRLVTFRSPERLCTPLPKNELNRSGKLQKFDDVACRYKSEMNLGIIKFTNNCSRMTSSLDLKFIEYTRYDDFERTEGDEYMNSTIKLSAEWGSDKLKIENGPLKLEAKVGGSIEIEMDRQGISDIVLGVEAKAGAGHNMFDKGLEKEGSIAGKDVIDTTVEVGVEGRISLISGKGSIDGTGKLSGVKFNEW